ncbi:MAG: GNAT family N-acetyltransferase [Thermoleophilia bacterium]|nr:GNAT family N-acetyltransferase [Thermoleophilia bacterium]
MDYVIERANDDDREGILAVMAAWNMHHVPSPEMEELDLSCFFVARARPSGEIIGAAGYRILSADAGKTTLLGVFPEFTGTGIGRELQIARLQAMHEAGVRTVTTNADRPDVIVWYKKHFGYHEVGTLEKLCSFGLVDVPMWTTMQMDLEEYFATEDERERRRSDYISHNDPAPLSPYPPLIINVSLTGTVPTKRRTPHVPVSVDEIVEDAVLVHDAGAHIVHLHARDEQGSPTPSAQYYEKIIGTLHKERPGLLCCVTTSGRNWSDFESRSEVLNLAGVAKPDLASLTLGSFNFLSGPSVNSITMVEQLALAMKERGIKPELEVFDSGMLNLARYLERHDLLTGTKYFNLLLGNLNTAPATLGSLAWLVQSLPERSIWSVGGIGHFQLPMNVAAVVGGGHVRVGLEDTVYYDYERTTLAQNVDLVRRIVRVASELQRPLASLDQVRVLLGIE